MTTPNFDPVNHAKYFPRLISEDSLFDRLDKNQIRQGLKYVTLNIDDSIYVLQKVQTNYKLNERFKVVHNLQTEIGELDKIDINKFVKYLAAFGKCLHLEAVQTGAKLIRSLYAKNNNNSERPLGKSNSDLSAVLSRQKSDNMLQNQNANKINSFDIFGENKSEVKNVSVSQPNFFAGNDPGINKQSSLIDFFSPPQSSDFMSSDLIGQPNSLQGFEFPEEEKSSSPLFDVSSNRQPSQMPNPFIGFDAQPEPSKEQPKQNSPQNPFLPSNNAPPNPFLPAQQSNQSAPQNPFLPAKEQPKPAEEPPQNPFFPAKEQPKQQNSPANPFLPANASQQNPFLPAKEPVSEPPQNPFLPAKEQPKQNASPPNPFLPANNAQQNSPQNPFLQAKGPVSEPQQPANPFLAGNNQQNQNQQPANPFLQASTFKPPEPAKDDNSDEASEDLFSGIKPQYKGAPPKDWAAEAAPKLVENKPNDWLVEPKQPETAPEPPKVNPHDLFDEPKPVAKNTPDWGIEELKPVERTDWLNQPEQKEVAFKEIPEQRKSSMVEWDDSSQDDRRNTSIELFSDDEEPMVVNQPPKQQDIFFNNDIPPLSSGSGWLREIVPHQRRMSSADMFKKDSPPKAPSLTEDNDDNNWLREIVPHQRRMSSADAFRDAIPTPPQPSKLAENELSTEDDLLKKYASNECPDLYANTVTTVLRNLHPTQRPDKTMTRLLGEAQIDNNYIAAILPLSKNLANFHKIYEVFEKIAADEDEEAVQYAIMNQYHAVKNECGRDILCQAASRNNFELVRYLIQHDVKYNHSDIDGKNAFFWFCSKGNYEAVRYFLKLPEVDVNSPNNNKFTTLMAASLSGHFDIVTILSKVPGIDVNAKDKYNHTALMNAASNGDPQIVKILIQIPGIDLNATDHMNKTALNLASLYQRHEVVQILQEASSTR